jgi:hypothetical protein
MDRQLTDGERSLLTHVCRFGSDGYPIRKLGRGWVWHSEGRGIKGPPVIFKTKRAFNDIVARKVASGMSPTDALRAAQEGIEPYQNQVRGEGSGS